MDNSKFSKKIFALLLDRARGERSWRQFALECDVSYMQMRKLATCAQENPPRPKLIKKIADCSDGGVELQDLMFACGLCAEGSPLTRAAAPTQTDSFFEKYKSLTPKQRKSVEDFLDFVVFNSHKQ